MQLEKGSHAEAVLCLVTMCSRCWRQLGGRAAAAACASTRPVAWYSALLFYRPANTFKSPAQQTPSSRPAVLTNAARQTTPLKRRGQKRRAMHRGLGLARAWPGSVWGRSPARRPRLQQRGTATRAAGGGSGSAPAPSSASSSSSSSNGSSFGWAGLALMPAAAAALFGGVSQVGVDSEPIAFTVNAGEGTTARAAC